MNMSNLVANRCTEKNCALVEIRLRLGFIQYDSSARYHRRKT